MSSPARPQILLRTSPDAPSVAGLPCAVRAAFRAGAELAPERIVIAGADEGFLARWARQLRAAGAPILSDRAGAAALDARLPLLAVAADVFPDAGALAGFAASAGADGGRRRSLPGGVAAIYVGAAAAVGAGRLDPSDVHARALAAALPEDAHGVFFDAREPSGAAAAAQAQYRALAKDTDGYLARFDRRLSLALTRLLLPLPVTPNQVTAASLALGLAGAWWLAAPSAALQLRGALALWFCCLLDGSDGEIARLKLLATPRGGEFDLFADHATHLATFVALPVGAARLHPGVDWRLPGIALVTGFLAAGAAVWRLILRAPRRRRGAALVVERLASRDYVYLIVALAAIGRLDWFVWAAAAGSHAFWMWLVWSALSARPEEVG